MLRRGEVTAGGRGEHAEDEELQRPGEGGGGEAAPGAGERGQGQEVVEGDGGGRGLGHHRRPGLLLDRLRVWVEVVFAGAGGGAEEEEGEEERHEGGDGSHLQQAGVISQCC